MNAFGEAIIWRRISMVMEMLTSSCPGEIMSIVVRRALSIVVMALSLLLAIGSIANASPAHAVPAGAGDNPAVIHAGSGADAPQGKYRFSCFIMLQGCMVLTRAETAAVADAPPGAVVSTITLACAKAPSWLSVACGAVGGVLAIQAASNANEARQTGRCLAIGIISNMPATMIAPCD